MLSGLYSQLTAAAKFHRLYYLSHNAAEHCRKCMYRVQTKRLLMCHSSLDRGGSDLSPISRLSVFFFLKVKGLVSLKEISPKILI